MKRRFSRKPPPPCAELRPDDGIDPGTLRPADRHRVTNRKALQLCEQIAHTLGSVFAGECADDLLRDLLVESVQPAPDSTRLLVSVASGSSVSGADLEQIHDRLQKAAGMLRCQIARAIHRKRVPELLFRVVPRASS